MDSHEPKDQTSPRPNLKLRPLVGAVLATSAVLALPIVWPPLPAPGIYAIFGSVLMGVGTFLFATAGRPALRSAMFGGGAAAVAIAVAFLFHGRLAIIQLLADVQRDRGLAQFGYTPTGFALTAIGFICFCGLLAAACGTVVSGRRFVGALAVLLLCYWALVWHQMAVMQQAAEIERLKDAIKTWERELQTRDAAAKSHEPH